jgi:hypothetical protein
LHRKLFWRWHASAQLYLVPAIHSIIPCGFCCERSSGWGEGIELPNGELKSDEYANKINDPSEFSSSEQVDFKPPTARLADAVRRLFCADVDGVRRVLSGRELVRNSAAEARLVRIPQSGTAAAPITRVRRLKVINLRVVIVSSLTFGPSGPVRGNGLLFPFFLLAARRPAMGGSRRSSQRSCEGKIAAEVCREAPRLEFQRPSHCLICLDTSAVEIP